MTFSPPKIIFLALLIALVLTFRAALLRHQNQGQLQQLRAAVASASAQSRQHLSESTSLRQRLASEHAALARALGSFQQAQLNLDQSHPESRWASPPPILPRWEQPSPFIWIEKKALTSLPIPTFSDRGNLNPSLAQVLLISPEKQRDLNRKIAGLLADYQTQESARAALSTNHLPGIQNGSAITLRIPPLPEEEKEKFKNTFAATLHDELGAQRAQIVSSLSQSWMNEQFSDFGRDEKVISAVRHPDGTYNVSRGAGGSTWMSVGGQRDLSGNIPPHLSSNPSFLRISLKIREIRRK
jgi:hypothetical protein